MNVEYCECETISEITTNFNDWCTWDVCCKCNKVIDGSYENLNHYDGEDHCNYY